MKPTVLLDVDGVVADCSTAMYELAQRVFPGRPLNAPPWQHYDTPKGLGLEPDEAERFWQHARDTDWAHTIKTYPEAIDGVSRLREVADIAFCTSPWRGNQWWCHHRLELLTKWFPGIDVIQTNAKHRVIGNFLVDDKYEQIATADSVWTGLLWTHPYNAHHKDPLSGIWVRVNGWDDVIREVTR